MSLLERMDRLVYATRIDRLIFMKSEPRSYRWTPLLVIAALVAGYGIMANAGRAIPDYFVGWFFFYGAFLAAGFLRALGPRFTATATGPLDERELMVKSQAHAIAGIVLGVVMMLGCFYMAAAGAPFLWHPQGPLDWINLGFGVQAVSLLLPTWIASWIESPREADAED
ncbi:hypothetical protein [Sphingosinicella terrae]|uniref:hypothetical protein n=1 Tax=Sphingosinicella terrae TaxID=2172047 RepID=UPI000E0D70F0|nr:hypothetical protein [Sphingosinicella terrae]